MKTGSKSVEKDVEIHAGDDFSRPTAMQIDLSALTHNLHAIRAHVGKTKIMAVVKANAYGHGLIECARHLAGAGADYFGVALVEEGTALRRAGLTAPILIFGGLWNEQIKQYLECDLDITASSADKLRAIDAAADTAGKRARVHLKIDTGMGRIGVQHDRLPRFADAVLEARHCDIIGVYSHFATAEEADQNFAMLQLERFNASIEYLRSRGISWRLTHMANSAGLMNFPESHFDMVRPGLALYGIVPDAAMEGVLPLRSVMRLTSKVVYFKVVETEQGISYGHRWRAPQQTRIVTVPVGYGDGYSRGLSGRAEVLIRGRRYPVVGSICMNQMMVDVGADEAFNGDEVVLIGRQEHTGRSEEITAAELAEKLGTTPHEILTNTNLRVPRIYLS